MFDRLPGALNLWACISRKIKRLLLHDFPPKTRRAMDLTFTLAYMHVRTDVSTPYSLI